MKNLICVLLFVSIIVSVTPNDSLAQESDGYNELSVYPVNDAYIMWKKTLWRQMDLKEKQNLPFFSQNGELPRIIIQAVKDGLLIPYNSDSVKDSNIMSKEVFMSNILDEDDVDDGFGGGEDDFGGFGGFGFDDGASADVPSGPMEIPPREFNLLELKEHMFFDRIRSRMYFDIQSVTLLFPATSSFNRAGFIKPIASFRYKDLVELFLSMPEQAIWYNSQNMAEHRNFADAFNLRLFSAHIIKFANPNDERVSEIYNKSDREGILASLKIEFELVDFENELWEF